MIEHPLLHSPTSKIHFFIHQHRRSTKTIRINYGLEGMKYIIQVYQGEINGHGEKERLPEEFQYEFEQEMLKQVHDEKRTQGKGMDSERFTTRSSSTLISKG